MPKTGVGRPAGEKVFIAVKSLAPCGLDNSFNDLDQRPIALRTQGRPRARSPSKPPVQIPGPTSELVTLISVTCSLSLCAVMWACRRCRDRNWNDYLDPRRVCRLVQAAFSKARTNS